MTKAGLTSVLRKGISRVNASVKREPKVPNTFIMHCKIIFKINGILNFCNVNTTTNSCNLSRYFYETFPIHSFTVRIGELQFYFLPNIASQM